MTKKQGQNLFDVLQLLATQYPEALTANKRKQAYDDQQYNDRLKQEGERSVYGGRNVEIGNYAVPDSKASRLAIEADALAREGKPRIKYDGTIGGKQEQDILDLNALLSKTKYRNMEGKNAGVNYKYIPEFEGMTDEEIGEQKLAEALDRKKQKYSGNLVETEPIKKWNSELEQADNDVAFYSALKKAPKAAVKYDSIEEALEPSEALLEGDLQKYVRSTGERLKTDEALKAMDKGAVNREQLQTLRPVIGDKKYEGLERNIDASEKPSRAGGSTNPYIKRVEELIDGVTPKTRLSVLQLAEQAKGLLAALNNPEAKLMAPMKEMFKREYLNAVMKPLGDGYIYNGDFPVSDTGRDEVYNSVKLILGIK